MARPARKMYRKRVVKRRYAPKGIPRSILRSQEYLPVKCEQYFNITQTTSEPAFKFNGVTGNSGTMFLNIKDVIANSQSFSKYNTLFDKMKITQISVTFTPSTGTLNSNISYDLLANLHLQRTSDNNVYADLRGEDSVYYHPYALKEPRTKTWRFLDNQYVGNPGGYGTIFGCTAGNVGTLTGQLSVCAPADLATLSPVQIFGFYTGKITVNVIFMDKHY